MSSSLPSFASIGSLIIDDIIFSNGRKECDILGGGGVFAIYGKAFVIKPFAIFTDYKGHSNRNESMAA
jgi:hypothetical protein